MAPPSKALMGTAVLLGALSVGGVMAAGSVGARPLGGPAPPLLTAAPVAVAAQQPFVGSVNGQTANATINVVCPGTLRKNQTGHPAEDQTIEVENPTTPVPAAAAGGFTGTRATSIAAHFVPASSVGASIKWMFTDYGTQPIPASVLLPCTGTSTVLFAPRPYSHTARSERVAVTFAACTSAFCGSMARSGTPTDPGSETGRAAPGR